MRKKLFILVCSVLLSFSYIHSQKDDIKLSFKLGYSAIPLHIERTDRTRWLTYQSYEAGYQLNDKITVLISYFGNDIRLNRFSVEEFFLYSETPRLNSYEEALMYVGHKTDPTELGGYAFGGIHYSLVKKRFLEVQANAQFGFRQGYSYILENVFQSSSLPNGFEVHITTLSSSSLGLKFGIAPRFNITKFAFIEPSFGSYIFTNWPVIQFFGSIHLGASISFPKRKKTSDSL